MCWFRRLPFSYIPGHCCPLSVLEDAYSHPLQQKDEAEHQAGCLHHPPHRLNLHPLKVLLPPSLLLGINE